jgi:hypothetical protein
MDPLAAGTGVAWAAPSARCSDPASDGSGAAAAAVGTSGGQHAGGATGLRCPARCGRRLVTRSESEPGDDDHLRTP